MDRFLEKHSLPSPTQERTDNLTSPLLMKDTKLVIQSLAQRKCQAQTAPLGNPVPCEPHITDTLSEGDVGERYWQARLRVGQAWLLFELHGLRPFRALFWGPAVCQTMLRALGPR